MNIISQLYDKLNLSFMNYLQKYFHEHNYYNKSSDFFNYLNFMNDLDNFSSSFIKDVIVSYFEYIDNVFFNSSYRKNFCTSKGFIERKNYVTLFGSITFKRRYYYDRINNEHFFFVDLFFNLPKRKHFDPCVCAELVNYSSSFSYSKAGALVSDKISSKFDNNVRISRATTRNTVMSFNTNVNDNDVAERKRIERLFIMLDEKFIPSQFNNNKDHMAKAAIIFEGTELEYKTKRKDDSTDRYRLIKPHTCSSINNELTLDVLNYVYNNYDTEHLKELYFMGDCAKWIKDFPKSHWFKFTKDTNVYFSMDGYHFAQAINNITTTKRENENWRNALNHSVKVNNKTLFMRLCDRFIEENPTRESAIIVKEKYILNNWEERQLYQNKPYLKCSMESHISHIFADLFTARPKAYSKKGLEQLLKLRLLKVNGRNIKDLYYKSINNKIINNLKGTTKYRRDLNLEFSSENIYDIEYNLSPTIAKKLYFNK